MAISFFFYLQIRFKELDADIRTKFERIITCSVSQKNIGLAIAVYLTGKATSLNNHISSLAKMIQTGIAQKHLNNQRCTLTQ
jgi:hypothetical protein